MLLPLAKLHGEPEIFYSIQGEGIQLGRPSIFVRTTKCNLHCVWCDTDYTWNWLGTRFPHANDAVEGYAKFSKKDWIVELPVEDVAERIRAFPCKNVILTGGEPMLHQAALVALMDVLKKSDMDYRFEVETNGTLLPTTEFEARINQFNVSPKLENSGNVKKLRERPKAYRHFANCEKSWFKFVIEAQNDLEEVLFLVKKYAIPVEKVLLMPQASSREKLAERSEWLIEICKNEGFRFSSRLHVEIWGSKKGV